MIGVFDSGLGGLSVLKYFLKDLPEYSYVYLGDSARAPYGGRSEEVIYNYTKEAVDFLFSKNCQLIIIACNSATAQALRKIQQEYLPKKYPGKNVLGVVRPLVEKVAKKEDVKKVGIIGTKATINSEIYKEEIGELNPEIKVFQKATPLLVPLIEEGWTKRIETKMILKKYLTSLKREEIDALVLGCTHYPYLLEQIRRIMPKNTEVYNSGEVIAQSLRNYLDRHREYDLDKSKDPVREFFTTDCPERFRELGEKFLGQKIKKINKISIKCN